MAQSVQKQLSPYKNENLFSRHYLKKVIQRTSIWEVDEDEIEEAFEELKEIYSEQKELLTHRKNNEEEVRNEFITPILRRVLDFKKEQEKKSGNSQKIPDYALYDTSEKKKQALDSGDYYEHAIGLVEAKAWKKDLEKKTSTGDMSTDDSNPTKQIVDYLIENPPQWGVLTNGKKWRLVHREASNRLDTYYEVDIENLLTSERPREERLEEFKYFYIFFRKQAFQGDEGDKILDEILEESLQYAEDIGEDLEKNIYEALEWIAKGFMEIKKNKDRGIEDEPIEKIHNHSFILLYRILFVLYADSRGILGNPEEEGYDDYSINSLIDEVTTKLDENDGKAEEAFSHGTLKWLQLNNQIFPMIDKGSQSEGIPKDEFYIPAYNGGLFDQENYPFFDKYTLRDSYLAKVLDLVARTEKGDQKGKARVDYYDLSVRHLGGIYEGLLEYQLEKADEDMVEVKEDGDKVVKTVEKAEEDGDSFSDDDIIEEGQPYLVTDDGERKATGSYYTPDYIVKYIVENTVGSKVEEEIEDLETDEEKAEAILDMQILDPAMGSAHFLVELIDYLATELVDHKEIEIEQAKREVARQCVYGVDVNPLATELGKLSIWLKTISEDKPLSFLDHHIKTGNSLIGADIHDINRHPEEDEDSERQVTIGEEFGEENAGVVRANVQEMLKKFKEIQEKQADNPEDIKEQEELYQEFLDFPFRKRFDVLADVYTSHYFENDYKIDDYNRLLQAFKLQEQKEEGDEEWDRVVEEDWVQKATDSSKRDVKYEEDNISNQKGFFHWKLEFPEVFFDIEEGVEKEDSGFDAVVGNPPYVKWSEFKDELDLLKSGEYRELNYKCRPNHGDAQPNIHLFFQQLSYDLLDESCTLSFILPQEWTERPKAKDFRDFYLKNCENKVIYFNEDFRVFKSSRETIGTNSLIIESEKNSNAQNSNLRAQFINSEDTESVKSALDDLDNTQFVETHSRDVNNLLGEKWVFDEVLDDLISIEKQSDHRLREGKYEIGGGFQPPTDLMDYFTITEDQYRKLSDKDKKYAFPVVKSSKRLQRYYKDSSGEYWIILNEFDSFDDVKSSLDGIYKHIESHRDELLDDKEEWWKFPRIRNFDIIKSLDSKLMTPRTGNSNSFCLDKENTVFKGTNAFVSHKDTENNLKLIAYLNSALLTAWYSYRGSDYHGINRYEPGKVKKMPVLELDKLPDDLERKADKIISAKESVQEEKRGFLEWVESEWNVEVDELSLKTHMREYWEYDFDEFMRIAKKNKSQIDGNVKSREFRELMKDEWENSMLTLEPLMNKIDELEDEIDAIVFDLYDLTEEEVETVLYSLDTPESEKASIMEKFAEVR
ncbi:MAG: hypothetical protein ACI8Z7_000653 [Candidatus Nanohaloarchaea archaeon]|jgi:hypothetical protein